MSGDKGRSKGSRVNESNGMPNALGWRLGYRNSATLPGRSRDEKRKPIGLGPPACLHMYEAAAAVDSLRTRRFKHGHLNESGYLLAIVANQ